MNKKTIDKLREKLAAITAKDPTMDAQYFNANYGLDLSCGPADDIELKYWNKCIKLMQGFEEAPCSSPCSKEKQKQLSESNLIKYLCTDDTTITTYDIANVFDCHISVAARKIANVKKWTGKEILDRKHVDSIEAYQKIMLENSKALKTYLDVETKRLYTIRDMRVMFDKCTDSVIKKQSEFLVSKGIFSIDMLATRLANRRTIS